MLNAEASALNMANKSFRSIYTAISKSVCVRLGAARMQP
jgi:hypothetical protein